VDTRLGASVTRQMRLHQKIEFVETYYLVETRRRGNPVWAHLPRPLDAGASGLGSHAGAWEPEQNNPIRLFPN
jgi:hypothetical protein